MTKPCLLLLIFMSQIIGSFPVEAKKLELGFKAQVMRLRAPVNIVDVLITSDKFDPSQYKNDVSLTRGWLYKETVIEKIGISEVDLFWVGPNKIWLDICYEIPIKVAVSSVLTEVRADLLKSNLTPTEIKINDLISDVCTEAQVESLIYRSSRRLSSNLIEVEYDIVFEDKKTRRIRKKMYFRASVSALVFSKDVNKNDLLSKISLRKEQKQWTGKELTVLPEGSWRMAKSRKRGAPIEIMDMTKNYKVKRGDQIKVFVSHKGISISAKATALGSGDIGENIEIRILQSGKVCRAVVAREGIANVSVF